MKRLLNALKVFWIVLRRPKAFNPNLIKTVGDMFKFLELTAKTGSPMTSQLRITKLAEILYDDDKDRPFLHLWCGVNEIDNPIKRLADLAQENVKLRAKILMTKEQEVQLSDTTKMSEEQMPGQ